MVVAGIADVSGMPPMLPMPMAVPNRPVEPRDGTGGTPRKDIALRKLLMYALEPRASSLLVLGKKKEKVVRARRFVCTNNCASVRLRCTKNNCASVIIGAYLILFSSVLKKSEREAIIFGQMLLK